MDEESKGGIRPWHIVVVLLLLFAAREIYGPPRAVKVALKGTTPEIVGRDLNDRDMKLGDFRGKVVMLDFWGHW